MIVDIEREDRVLTEVIQSLGPWKNFVVIGGGYALIIYKFYLADRFLGNPPVGTRDIDSLLPRRIHNPPKNDIAELLAASGFKHMPKDLDTPPTESFTKEIGGIEVEIEFLTDNQVRENKHRNVSIAGIVAQPLSYLEMSLEQTLRFRTLSNEQGLVVSPGAWLFHKGLTFTRRTSDSKMLKDLYGIWYLASQLGPFSIQAISLFKDLALKHPKWYGTFRKNLELWIEEATPLAWTLLQTQDPFAELKRPLFIKLINDALKV